LVSEELAARLLGEPTDVLVTQTEQGIYRDFFTSLQRSNQSFDAFLASKNTTPEAFREDVKRQAAQVTAQALALDALALHLALEITDEEIRAEFEASGAEDPDALFLQWKGNGRLSEVREGLLRMKAARHLNETAEVFEPGKKPVNPLAAAADKKPAAKATKGGKKGKAAEAPEVPAETPEVPAGAETAAEAAEVDSEK
ncbi:MAG: hypothetical protein LBU31_00970, partial [Coriobacteriales bacterium]|nr:hypothetical protein [Coriobacteriales bacterium]